MYSIKVEPPDGNNRRIHRTACSNNALELAPVIIQICKDEYHFVNPVLIYTGDGRYRVFDYGNPSIVADVTITE